MALNISILGAGITGLTSALALHKHLPEPKPEITIYEIRNAPSTIGGAVNLTPKALRYLDYLGIASRKLGAECRVIELYDLYTGAKIHELNFQDSSGRGLGKSESKRFYAARVMRSELQAALLKAVENQASTKIIWGRKVVKIEESSVNCRLTFESGEPTTCDLLLGCDGIHSAARTLLVEPQRQPTYTGVSVVMAKATLRPEIKLKWTTTGLTMSQRGSLMASYFEDTREEQYIAAVMEIKEVADREGWKVRGSDQKAIKADILDRFQNDVMPELADLVLEAGDWTLYPTHMLSPKGRWISPGERCILLGDAAHAMPPQGESTGICIEDAIIFSRAMMHSKHHDFLTISAAYEKLRRPHIDHAYDQAVQRWENVKDTGSFAYRVKLFLTPWFLWWTEKARIEDFSVDYSDYEFVL